LIEDILKGREDYISRNEEMIGEMDIVEMKESL
jgi:hypothetical protein